MFNFKKLPYWFCFPALLTIAVFAVYPVFHSFFISFFKMDLRSNVFAFVGLGNYKSILTNARTLMSVYHTFLFTVTSVTLELILGMIAALLLHRQFKSRGTVRALSIVPWAIPTVVAALVWRWIFNDRFGLINEVLLRIGMIDSPIAFLASPAYSRLAVIAVEVWKTTPFMAILLLAGLEMIPKELYEAAKVDGASALQRFRLITIPLLVPVILVSLLFRTMDALRIFDTVYVLTGGGPGNSTETLSLFTYKTMFSHLQMGQGSALAVLTFLIVTAVSVLYVLIHKRLTIKQE